MLLSREPIRHPTKYTFDSRLSLPKSSQVCVELGTHLGKGWAEGEL